MISSILLINFLFKVSLARNMLKEQKDAKIPINIIGSISIL